MTIVRRRGALGITAGAVIGAPFVKRARAAEVSLKMHHFLGPTSAAHALFMAPWAERVQAQSEGRIEVEIFPSMSLGGRPPQLYRQVRDGVVDIVWTLPGYTAGQFPRIEVFEIPFVHHRDTVPTNLAIQDLYEDWFAEEFADVQPILLHVHAGQAFHMVEDPIRSMQDCRGKKIRIPTRLGGWMIEAFGANPVGMPVPDIPQALSKQVVDGTLIPFEVSLPLKVHELTSTHTVGPSDERFGTAVFLFAMNKQRYEDLSDELRAIIDDNSDVNLAPVAGETWNEAEEPGKEAARSEGNEILELDDAAMEPFREAARDVAQRWIDEVSSQGVDGEGLLQAAREAVEARRKG